MDKTAKKGKIVVVSAPSGCGKSTIIRNILDKGDLPLRFSVSATNRNARPGEIDGQHYHFMTTPEFRRAIADNRFVEWEEVYPGRYYGTLKDELQKEIEAGNNVILDIDVKGAVNVKKLFGDGALTIFIVPPSVDEIRRRLEGRKSESPDVINERVGKAEYEMSFADLFDCQVVNDILEDAIAQTHATLKDFINQP